MAWRSGSVLRLFKTCTNPSHLNNYRLTAISGSSFVNNNYYCHQQQIRFNSDAVVSRLSAFNDVVASSVLPNIEPINFVFSDSAPVLATQDLLSQMHDLAGISWMSTIVLTTVSLRLFIGLPISVMQNKSCARLENIQPKAMELMKEIHREVSIAVKLYNWDAKRARRTFSAARRKHLRNLFEEYNCHPMRPVALGLLQVPTWLLFTGAVRNFVYMLPKTADGEVLVEQQHRFMQMFVENTSWMESLAAPDPFVLPAIFILAGLANIQVNSMGRIDPNPSRMQIGIRWVLRTLIVSLGLYSTTCPAALTLFWASSSVCALIVNILLRLNIVRSLFRIPTTPTTISIVPNFRGLFQFPRRRTPAA